GSNGAVRGMPAGAAAGRRAHCTLRPAHAHRRHTYATVLPATIDGIRAHFGNPTQITLLRMPVSAGSLHEKTVHNGREHAARAPISHCLSPNTALRLPYPGRPESAPTQDPCR